MDFLSWTISRSYSITAETAISSPPFHEDFVHHAPVSKPGDPSRKDVSRYQHGENITQRRQQEAVQLVKTRIDELSERLATTLPGATVLRGSATCAEIRIADTDSIRRFLQVVVTCPPSELGALENNLHQDGFRTGEPLNDTQLIRITHKSGRRPMFVLLEDAHDQLHAPGAPHPASLEGRRLRYRRLQESLRSANKVLQRNRDVETPHGTETETFEVHISCRAEESPDHIDE